jgi:Ca2+-transporting ATPase
MGGNNWIYAAIVAVLGLQALFTYWSPMTGLFGTAPIDGLAWLWAVMVGLLVFFAVESEKAWRRRGSSPQIERGRRVAGVDRPVR